MIPTAPSEIGRLLASARPSADMARNAGEYQRLYTYLHDRYANRVVLTFREIEDLLGFRLPDQARSQREWWANADPTTGRSTQSKAWTLASRTAIVHLVAQSVVFDRENSTGG